MNHIHFRGAMRPGSMRFARSLSDAFSDERAVSVQHYLSTKLRHRALRFCRRLARYLLGSKP